MNPVRGAALLWLLMGIVIIFLGLPQSISQGWRQVVYIILFGPPLWVAMEVIGEILLRTFIPKSVETWPSVWRITFYVLYCLLLVFLFLDFRYIFGQL